MIQISYYDLDFRNSLKLIDLQLFANLLKKYILIFSGFFQNFAITSFFGHNNQDSIHCPQINYCHQGVVAIEFLRNPRLPSFLMIY